MEAEIYQLESMRSRRNSRMLMARIFPTQLALDTWALTINATLFSVEYWRAMASFHARLLSLR